MVKPNVIKSVVLCLPILIALVLLFPSNVYSQNTDDTNRVNTSDLAQNPVSSETIPSDNQKFDNVEKPFAKSLMGHKFSIYGNLAGTLGKLKPLLANSWGVNIAYENNLTGILPEVIAPFLHGARAEAGFGKYSASDSITQIRFEVGPEWFLSFWPAKFGKIQLALMPGMTWLNIQSSSFHTQGVLFSASLLAGYEYDFGSITQNTFLSRMFLFLHGRAGIIYDKTSPWTGLGGDFGVGLKF